MKPSLRGLNDYQNHCWNKHIRQLKSVIVSETHTLRQEQNQLLVCCDVLG